MSEWQKSDPVQTAKILGLLNTHVKPVPFSLNDTTIRSKKLPFYEDVVFYEMTDLSAVPAARKYAAVSGETIYMMNWTNAPIYELNSDAPLRLNEKNVSEYVRFFFDYVRGRHGRFVIIENFDDFKWQNEPPPQARKAMQDILQPVQLIDRDGEGAFTLESYMLFKDSLFRTLIHVKPTGEIDMSDEELKIEGMPVVQDVMMA